jgi:hypothetical protein
LNVIHAAHASWDVLESHARAFERRSMAYPRKRRSTFRPEELGEHLGTDLVRQFRDIGSRPKWPGTRSPRNNRNAIGTNLSTTFSSA